MSYEAGWKALNMEMTDKVPRTEYSVQNHWELLKVVTGIDTDVVENRERAKKAFVTAWDYSFMWTVVVTRKELEKRGRVTRMGHAVYQELPEGQSDFIDNRDTPFEDPEEVLNLDPVKEYGEVPESEIIELYENAYQTQNDRWGQQCLTMSGVYITLVSGLIDIFGWDSLLLAMGMDPKRFNKVVDGYAEWVQQYFDAFAKTDIPVFMCHDDICWTSGPFTSPEWYRKHVFPKYKKYLEPIKAAGKKIIFTSDGTYTEFFDDIIDCGAEMLVLEPTSDMAALAKKHGDRIGFVGNADCRVLQDGSKEDIRKEVERCMEIGKPYPGFIMAVGNHIPQNVPVDSCLWYNECYEKMAQR